MGARFFGALYACRYAAPRMAAGGSITLCSGVAGTRPQAGRGAGAATTAAVESFVRAGWTLA
jgi:NAD(P)-dependent dehydrogenase (short-subunit alcohol dehydrogenase family)